MKMMTDSEHNNSDDGDSDDDDSDDVDAAVDSTYPSYSL